MKPLIYVASSTFNNKIREEDHLFEALKASLEAINHDYATSVFDEYDLVHFVMPDDVRKIVDAKRAGMKTIASALYCETEKKTAMVDFKGNNKAFLKDKYRKSLNLVDLVLVPGARGKKFLEEQGVISRIEVLPAPINFSRFIMKNERQNRLFGRYFGEKKDTVYVLCIGDYSNKAEMDSLIEIVGLCPFAKFYFFGANYSVLGSAKYVKKAPDNIIFSTLVDDDIYCSALTNAQILLVLNPRKVEAMDVLEAMAAKTQILAICPQKDRSTILVDGENAYLRSGIIEIVDCLHKLVNEKLNDTTAEAYKFAQQFNLEKSGEHLKQIYQSLLGIKR